MGCSGSPSYVENDITCSLLIFAISQACGGPNRVSVYSSGPVTALAIPTAQTTNLPGKWTYKGCLRCVSILELTFSELLNLVNDTWFSEPANKKMFPYEIIWPNNNTAVACMNQCVKFGFDAAGVEVHFSSPDVMGESDDLYFLF